MALKTLTVGDLQRVLAGLDPSQPLLLLNEENGLAAAVDEIHPVTLTDKATGHQVLLLEFELGLGEFGFEPDAKGAPTNAIDSSEE